MLKNNGSVWCCAVFWAFFYESLGSPYVGFYVFPSVIVVESFFYLPFVSRELNAGLVFVLGILLTSVTNMKLLLFVVPFYLILSSILYIFAKK